MSEPTPLQISALFDLGFRRRTDGTWYLNGRDFKCGANAVKKARALTSSLAKRLASPPTGDSKGQT